MLPYLARSHHNERKQGAFMDDGALCVHVLWVIFMLLGGGGKSASVCVCVYEH